MLTIAIIWIILSILCGTYANNKGRSGIGFFFLSLLISPLIGFIAALIVKKDENKLEQIKIESGENKKCPFCAELIKNEAIICRFCGKEMPKDAIPSVESTLESIEAKQKKIAEQEEKEKVYKQKLDLLLMQTYNITMSSVNNKYIWHEFSFDKLESAVEKAKLFKRKKSLMVSIGLFVLACVIISSFIFIQNRNQKILADKSSSFFLKAKQFAYANNIDSCNFYINKTRAISSNNYIEDFASELLKLDSAKYIERSLNFISEKEYKNITNKKYTQPGYSFVCFLLDTGLNRMFYDKLYEIRNKRTK